MTQANTALLPLAIDHHRQGRRVEARQLYTTILAGDPANIDALHLLGVLSLEIGEKQAAVDLIGQALAALRNVGAANTPAAAPLLTNLGNAQQALGLRTEAAASYRKALRLQPDIPETHSNLGNVLDADGDYDAAVVCYRRALALRPDFVGAWFNLGNVLNRLGHFDDAEQSYREALKRQPGMMVAEIGLSRALMGLGRSNEAIAAIEQLLERQPSAAPPLAAMAALLRGQGRTDEALGFARRAALRDPSVAETHLLLGDLLDASGDQSGAIDAYQQATALQPDHPDAWFNLGRLAQVAGNADAAIDFYQQALAIRPQLAEGWFNLGNAFHKADRFADAADAYAHAVRLKQDYAEAHAGLGTVLQKLDQFQNAIASLKTALRLKPDYADAYYNLGNALQDVGQVDAAIESFERAFTIKPNYVSAHFNQALALMSAGDYVRGWRKYEYRWHPDRDRLVARTFSQPLWLGDGSLEGKTILLHSEQGLGDTLQFCRYVPLVASLGARIVLEVQKPLVGLLTASFASDRITIVPTDPSWPAGDGLPPFDLHCPLLSLPLAFGTTIDSVPTAIPYLKADPERTRFWHDRLAEDAAIRAGALKVGLVWAGEARKNIPDAVEVDRRRSMKLAEFAALTDLSGLKLVSLQKGEPADQAASAPFDLAMINLMNEINDFADTAALIDALDLVISVDTSVAHLAGALGKPVWLLSRANGCWRWLLQGETSPWYPSLRVLRQETPFQWQPVVAGISQNLETLLLTRAARF